jgi:hypothetical protein
MTGKGERKLKVSVWGKPHEITLYPTSKTVWIAVGDYMGERIEVKGQTEGAAVKSWIVAARYRATSKAKR